MKIHPTKEWCQRSAEIEGEADVGAGIPPIRQQPNDLWTEGHAPWVEPDGNVPFRYRVESLSKPESHHIVDLTARDGHGECSCIHFATVARPNFERTGKWIPWAKGRQGVSECVHLRAAWDYFHLSVTVPMLASFENGIPKS